VAVTTETKTMAMSTSREGKLFLARWEALVLVAYQDGPHPSIGFGHNSKSLRVGDRISVAEAFHLLEQDLRPIEKRLNKELKVPITQAQFDALVDLNYNTGNRYIWDFVRLINAGKIPEAIDLFPACDKNLAGEQKEGLHARRLAEQALFETGYYGPDKPIPYWEGNPHIPGTRKEYHVKPGDL
jgi:lysozyme